MGCVVYMTGLVGGLASSRVGLARGASGLRRVFPVPQDFSYRYQARSMSSAAKRKATDAPSAAEKKAKSSTITGFFSSTPSSKAPFDKAKWAASLPADKRELLKLEIDTLDASWLAVLKDALLEPSFLNLKRFLQGEFKANRVYPPANEVYSWSRLTPFNKVKVVILGQDPYHGPKQAHGLSFSVKPPTKAPPSLNNIFGALENDYPTFKRPANSQGLLTPWAERGVLMLNTCLTVQPSNANSHANKGWETFTQKVIELVAQKRTSGVVFMAWGKPAQGRVAKVNSCHPSPLAAFKGPVFFKDGHHFRQCNEWLEKKYGDDGPIDWNAVNPSNVSLFKSKPQASTSAKAAEAAASKSLSPDNVVDKHAPAKGDAVPSLDDEEEALREAEAEEMALPTNKKANGKGKKIDPVENEYGEDDVDWDEAALKSDQIEEESKQAKGKGKGKGKK
ncbi:Uracil-DNA glycosylase [Drechslerella dactyloides]|uniref:Uracil-DNA glycosylase n=1 Tax=Drechslerella dactyloides TaxID=74499 RepID=A0AAD6NK82_DREDA|nr:Uracil-DNA glycosylase [Drechslerella dactyloides]